MPPAEITSAGTGARKADEGDVESRTARRGGHGSERERRGKRQEQAHDFEPRNMAQPHISPKWCRSATTRPQQLSSTQASLAAQLRFEDFCRLLSECSEARGAEKKVVLVRG